MSTCRQVESGAIIGWIAPRHPEVMYFFEKAVRASTGSGKINLRDADRSILCKRPSNVFNSQTQVSLPDGSLIALIFGNRERCIDDAAWQISSETNLRLRPIAMTNVRLAPERNK
jgi:hypothetical protein